MYDLVSVDHNGMETHLARSNLKGFKKCCISSAVHEADDGILWNDSKEDGNVRGECEEHEGTDCSYGENNTDWYRQIECDVLCVLIV